MEPRLLSYKIHGTELILSFGPFYEPVYKCTISVLNYILLIDSSAPALRLAQHMLNCVPEIFTALTIWLLISMYILFLKIWSCLKALHPISHTFIIAAQLNVFDTFDRHISNSSFRLFLAGALTVTPGHGSQYNSPCWWRIIGCYTSESLTLEPCDSPPFWS